MKEKINYGTPWVKVGLRIFSGLGEAKEYCERKGIPENMMEYDNEKNADASIMAAQQVAILNELERKINLQIAENDETAKYYEKLSQKAADIEKQGRHGSAGGTAWLQASFDKESYAEEADRFYRRSGGMLETLAIIHDMQCELDRIAMMNKVYETRDVK